MAEGRVMGVIRGPGKARVEEESHRPCTVVILFSETDMEEPFTSGERTSRRGLILGVRGSPCRVSKPRSCTLVFLFREPVLEEPFTVSAGKVRVLNEPVEAPRSWGNRGSNRGKLVTIAVKAIIPLLDEGGASRAHHRKGTVPENSHE